MKLSTECLVLCVPSLWRSAVSESYLNKSPEAFLGLSTTVQLHDDLKAENKKEKVRVGAHDPEQYITTTTAVEKSFQGKEIAIDGCSAEEVGSSRDFFSSVMRRRQRLRERCGRSKGVARHIKGEDAQVNLRYRDQISTENDSFHRCGCQELEIDSHWLGMREKGWRLSASRDFELVGLPRAFVLLMSARTRSNHSRFQDVCYLGPGWISQRNVVPELKSLPVPQEMQTETRPTPRKRTSQSATPSHGDGVSRRGSSSVSIKTQNPPKCKDRLQAGFTRDASCAAFLQYRSLNQPSAHAGTRRVTGIQCAPCRSHSASN